MPPAHCISLANYILRRTIYALGPARLLPGRCGGPIAGGLHFEPVRGDAGKVTGVLIGLMLNRGKSLSGTPRRPSRPRDARGVCAATGRLRGSGVGARLRAAIIRTMPLSVTTSTTGIGIGGRSGFELE